MDRQIDRYPYLDVVVDNAGEEGAADERPHGPEVAPREHDDGLGARLRGDGHGVVDRGGGVEVPLVQAESSRKHNLISGVLRFMSIYPSIYLSILSIYLSIYLSTQHSPDLVGVQLYNLH